MEFDYIIVGAGSAGCALATRLSDDGRHSVLLVEAGGSDLALPAALWIQMPIGYGKSYFDGRINWKYTTDPVAGLGGRQSYWPRGRVLGGSSAINAMVWVRGHPLDYDEWGEAATGWSWRDVAPVFERIECLSGPLSEPDASAGRGHVGRSESSTQPMKRIRSASHFWQLPARSALPGTPTTTMDRWKELPCIRSVRATAFARRQLEAISAQRVVVAT